MVAAATATKPYVHRFNALEAEDPYLLTGATAARWRTLVDELKHDDHAPVDLVVRSEMMLAGSLKGDDAVAPSLSLAQDALARAEAAHITDGSLHAALLAMLAARETQNRKATLAVAHADAALAETERADGKDSWAYGNAAMVAADAYGAIGKRDREEPLSITAERLAAACLPPGTSLIGGTISSHAAVLQLIGRIDEAFAEHERAVTWDAAHLPDSDPIVPYALGQLAWSLRSAGRQLEAEALLRRAVGLYARYHPELVNERASTVGKFFVLLLEEGKGIEADAMWAAWQDVAARARDLNPQFEVTILDAKARSAEAQGDFQQSLAMRRRATALVESHVSPRNPQLAYSRIGEAEMLAATGHAREGWAIAEPAAALLRETVPPTDVTRISGEITAASIALTARVDPAKAYAAAAPAAARQEALLRDAATSRADVVRLAWRSAKRFEAVARLALAAHEDEAAFHALQLANLSEAGIAGADATARMAAADPKIRVLIDRLSADEHDRRRLDRDRVAANAAGDAAKTLALDAAIRRNDGEAAATLGDLDRIFPAYRSLSRPQPVALAAFRASLGPDDVLLAPVPLLGETLVVTVTRDGVRWAVLPVPRSRVAGLLRNVLRSVEASRLDPHERFDTASARALGAIVLPPALAPVFAAHRHIIYYASAWVATLPPALLVTAPAAVGVGPAWLIRSHSISVATRLDPRPDTGRTPRDGFLGIGAPALKGKPLSVAMRGVEVNVGDFGKAGVPALAPLPAAAHELNAMGNLFPPGQRHLLIGAAATKPAFEGQPLDRYGVIAFATHSVVADALPGLTQAALVLTPAAGAGAANDGLLTTGEIAALHLDADWVILSACRTAGAADAQSARYSGLASAFIQAGARALLVSHWPVRDDAAARISVSTLAAARRGVDRPEALRQAMLALMRDRKVAGAANPAIWAPFVLIDR